MEDQRHFIRGVSPVSGARLWRLKTNQWKMKSAVWEFRNGRFAENSPQPWSWGWRGGCRRAGPAPPACRRSPGCCPCSGPAGRSSCATETNWRQQVKWGKENGLNLAYIYTQTYLGGHLREKRQCTFIGMVMAFWAKIFGIKYTRAYYWKILKD